MQPAGRINGYNTTSEVTHTEVCVSVPGRTVVNRMESTSKKNTQTGFLFFNQMKGEKMEQLFEPPEIRTTLSLISLARRDFEQGAPSDKPPRINEATGDHIPAPPPPAPRSSASLLANSLALKLLLAYSWNAAFSQSGKSNCCSHREPLTPTHPIPLLLQSCCCSGRL